MKKKNLIAILAVVVLAAVSLWLWKGNRKGTIDNKLRDFAVKDTASISKIYLVDKSGQGVTLTRNEDERWRVNGKFYARQDAVNTLLYTIYNVEVKSPVGKKAQDNVVKRLATGSTKIEIYNEDDELIKMYYVGGETQDALGTYMLLADEKTGQNSSVPFIMYIPGFEGYLTTRYFTDASEWRDRTVFGYVPTEIKSVKVEYPSEPQSSFLVNNKGENLYDVQTLNPPAPVAGFDTIAVKQYLSYFRGLQYESIEKEAAKVKRDSIVASQPLAIITVTDQKGGVKPVKFFRKRAQEGKLDMHGKPMQFDVDRLYAVFGEDFVLCQYYVFGKLLQSPQYFQQKRDVVKKS